MRHRVNVDRLAGECHPVQHDGLVLEGHDVVVPVPHVEAEAVLLVDAVRTALLLCLPPPKPVLREQHEEEHGERVAAGRLRHAHQRRADLLSARVARLPHVDRIRRVGVRRGDLVGVERGDLAGDRDAGVSVAEAPLVLPHGHVAVLVRARVVLVEAVVDQELADGEVVDAVAVHRHDPGHDTVVGRGGSGHPGVAGEEHGEDALVDLLAGVLVVPRSPPGARLLLARLRRLVGRCEVVLQLGLGRRPVGQGGTVGGQTVLHIVGRHVLVQRLLDHGRALLHGRLLERRVRLHLRPPVVSILLDRLVQHNEGRQRDVVQVDLPAVRRLRAHVLLDEEGLFVGEVGRDEDQASDDVFHAVQSVLIGTAKHHCASVGGVLAAQEGDRLTDAQGGQVVIAKEQSYRTDFLCHSSFRT